MLRLTADVNGKPVGYIWAHNTVQLPSSEGTLCVYHAATWDPETEDGLIGIEGIVHIREDGWAGLMRKVLDRTDMGAYGKARKETRNVGPIRHPGSTPGASTKLP